MPPARRQDRAPGRAGTVTAQIAGLRAEQNAFPALPTVIFLAFGFDPVPQILIWFGGVASFSILPLSSRASSRAVRR